MLAAPPLPGLDALARELLLSLDHSALASIHRLWPAPPLPLAPVVTSPAPAIARPPLPVLEWLTVIGARPHDFAGALVDAVCKSAPSLEWRQTYTLADIGADFLRNYGYTEIMGPAAPRYSRQLACGFLLLGPNTCYPRHRHDADEIYVTLSGEALWLQGDERWRRRRPGEVIHHAGGEPHAMRTETEPLLALYVWSAGNLMQAARLDPE